MCEDDDQAVPFEGGITLLMQTEGLPLDILDWARENMIGRWRIIRCSKPVRMKLTPAVHKLLAVNGSPSSGPFMNGIQHWTEVVFSEERDATLFKVFWL